MLPLPTATLRFTAELLFRAGCARRTTLAISASTVDRRAEVVSEDLEEIKELHGRQGWAAHGRVGLRR